MVVVGEGEEARDRRGEEREDEEANYAGMSELQQLWLPVREYFLIVR